MIEVEEPFIARSVQGVVVDPSGTAVPGAEVTMLGPDWKTELGRSKTDLRGRFDFHNRKAGTYFLQLSRAGFDPMRVRVIVKKGSKSELKIKMWLAT